MEVLTVFMSCYYRINKVLEQVHYYKPIIYATDRTTVRAAMENQCTPSNLRI